MSLATKMFSNSVYLFLDTLIVNIIGLLFWFFIGRFLPPKEFGIVSTSMNLHFFIISKLTWLSRCFAKTNSGIS